MTIKTNRKFRTLIATGFASCAFLAVHAADFAWNGGASGSWNSPANWLVGGQTAESVPGAGDTVTFAAATEITDDFAIGAGTLEVVRGADVTFDGVISGAGALELSGAGVAHLKGANTFSGGLTVVGTQTTTAASDLSGSVKIYNAKALGAGKASIDTTKGPALYIMDGVSEVDTELAFTSSAQNNTGVVYLPPGKGSVTFNKDIAWNLKSTFTGYSGAVYHFMGKVTSPSYTFGAWGKAHFHDVVNFGYWSGAADEFHLYVSGNKASQLHFNCPVYCHEENAFIKDYRWFAFVGPSSIVDLGGFNQRMESCTGWHYSTPRDTYCLAQPTTSGHGFTSTDKAIMTFALKNPTEGTPGPITESWHGVFSGKAGMCWDPVDAGSSFTFSNTVQTTAGELHVSNGTVRVTCGAGLPKLSKLVVGPHGVFEIASTASETAAEDLVFDDGATVTLGEGVVLNVRRAYMDGSDDPIADGEYTESSGYFTGAGKIVVESHVCNEWKAEVKTGDWFTDSNWSLGTVPGADDYACIPAGVAVALSSSTEKLYRLEIKAGATLKVSGWDTAIAADKVVVAGTITADAAIPATATEPTQRIFIQCGDLEVTASGALDMNCKGWASKGGPGFTTVNNAIYGGSAHGGFGSIKGVGIQNQVVDYGCLYDDPHAPVLPGSGGSYEGGGAIYVEATGTVIVNGGILASAADSRGVADTKPANAFCGSGGSIWIKCAKIEGHGGSIKANGGDGDFGAWPDYLAQSQAGVRTSSVGTCGGGGVIRIEYGAGQSEATLENMTVSAAGGVHRGYVGCPDILKLTAATEDRWRTEADLGTLTFSDDTIVHQLLGKGLSGRLVDVNSYTHEGDLAWTAGHVRFAKEGADVRVTGDFMISGAESRCEIGGVMTRTNTWIFVDRWGGALPNQLTVGGDLTVTGGAALDIRAGEANADGDGRRWGGIVTVAGNMTVGTASYVYPWSDIKNLAVSRFTVGGDFTVEAGGSVNADWRGAMGTWSAVSTTVNYFNLFGVSAPAAGLGPGGSTSGAGAAYGGIGGSWYSAISDSSDGPFSTSARARAYGDCYEPYEAGSGGGDGGYKPGSCGGGLVYVEAQGAVCVDGTITANGREPFSNNTGGNTSTFSDYYTYCKQGAGSGGAIYIFGNTFSGSGRLSARGGNALEEEKAGSGNNAGKTLVYSTAGGGGGRIAIAVGAQQKATGSFKLKRYETADAIKDGYQFDGDYDVGGGTNVWYVGTYNAVWPTKDVVQYPVAQGTAGTLGFSWYGAKPGLLLFFR